MRALAVVEFHLTTAQFWRLTPRAFISLIDALIQKDRKQYYASAMICSTLAELHRDPKKRATAYSPADFMPGGKDGQADSKPKGQSWEDQLAFVKALNAEFGGLVIPKEERGV